MVYCRPSLSISVWTSSYYRKTWSNPARIGVTNTNRLLTNIFKWNAWSWSQPSILQNTFFAKSLLVLVTPHDDVIKWKYFPRYWSFVRGINRSPVNSPHKGQWLGALMFTLICARINGWVNNCEAGDLRRNRAHYDVIVMTHWRVNGWDVSTMRRAT